MEYVEKMGLTSEIVAHPLFVKGWTAAFEHLKEDASKVELECDADGDFSLWSDGKEIGWVSSREATLWGVIELLEAFYDD